MLSYLMKTLPRPPVNDYGGAPPPMPVQQPQYEEPVYDEPVWLFNLKLEIFTFIVHISVIIPQTIIDELQTSIL